MLINTGVINRKLLKMPQNPAMWVKKITRKSTSLSFDQRLQKLQEVCRGWINYFKFASMQQKLIQLDGWLRNRLRYCIWTDWKKPERKRKNLIRLAHIAGFST